MASGAFLTPFALLTRKKTENQSEFSASPPSILRSAPMHVSEGAGHAETMPVHPGALTKSIGAVWRGKAWRRVGDANPTYRTGTGFSGGLGTDLLRKSGMTPFTRSAYRNGSGPIFGSILTFPRSATIDAGHPDFSAEPFHHSQCLLPMLHPTPA